MLSELNDLKILPLHCAVESNNLKVFDFLFSLYEQSFSMKKILQILQEKDKNGNNLLHYAAAFAKSKEVFEFLWMKIEKLLVDKEELKKFLLMKGFYERNALLVSISKQNENTFYFLFEQVFCRYFSIEEFAYERTESGENLLHYLARFGSVSMLRFATEKLKNEFSTGDLQSFIKLRSKDGNNLLHCAALQNKDQKSVEFLVNFIVNEVGSEEVKKMLSELNDLKILPLHCAVQSNNLKVFDFLFSLYEQNFDKMQILQFLREKDKSGDNLLHVAAGFAKSKEVFEFFWAKIEKLFEDKEELKKFLLVKGHYGKNALLKSIACQNENSFYFMFEQVFCRYFSIKEFAYESDEDGDNLLHYLARFGSVPMLKFALEKLKKEFSMEDLQSFIKLKSGNCYNLLHCATIQNKDVESVEFLVNFIENEVGSEEVKKMLSELNILKYLPLHCAVQSNNLKVFEFFFSIYEKNFTMNELTNIMMTPCDGNKNIFTLMRESGKISSKSELSKWQEVLDKYQEPIFSESDFKTDDNQCVEANLFDKIKEIREKMLKKFRFNSSFCKKPLEELSGIIDKMCTSETMTLIADTIASYDSIIFDCNPNKDFINSSQYYSTLPEYGEDLIYVVINYKTDEEKKSKFIFEMVKSAMQIVYANKSLPFFNHQKDKEEDLNDMSKEIKKYENCKDIENLNEILPKYFSTGFDSKINEKVLNFFNKFVKPDLKILDGNKIRELNRKFCLLKKPELKLYENYQNSAIEMKNLNETIFIKSNVPRMVLEIFYRDIKLSSCVDAENLFVNLKLINFDDIRELYLEIASSASIKRIFVDASDCSEKNLNILREGSPKSPIIYVGIANVLFTDLKEVDVDFTWNDFSEESQEKLLSKKIEYQNKFVEFGEIFKSNYEDLPCEFIEKLCSNQTMIISPIAPLPKLIERKFAIKRNIKDEIMFMRTCNESDFYCFKNESLSEILNYVESSPIILLTGETRTGKTKALQQIESRLANLGKNVKYLKFKDFEEFKDTESKIYIKNLILKKYGMVEYCTFVQYFNRGEAIIILDEIKDGVDETKLINMLENFEKLGKNQLFLGVEEKIGEKIEISLKPKVIKLIPLTEEEEKVFLINVLTENCKRRGLRFNYSKDDTTTNICENYFKNQISPALKQSLYAQSLETYRSNYNNNKFDEYKLLSANLDLLKGNEELFEYYENGTFYLTSPCFFRFLLANVIKANFEKPCVEIIPELIFELFIKICTKNEFKNLRKMLNELKIAIPNKQLASFCGNLFKKALENDSQLQLNFESDFMLANFITHILKNADWNEKGLSLASVISKMLISLGPYIDSNFDADEFLETALKVSEANFKELLTIRDQDKQKIIEVIASQSSDTKLIEHVLKTLEFFKINPSEFFNESIFKLAIKQNNINLLEFIIHKISLKKWEGVIKMAFECENIDVINTIRSKLPKDEVNLVFNEFEETKKNFFEDILAEDISKMAEFVRKFPKVKICENRMEKHLTALEFACRKQKFKSFDFLLLKNFVSSSNDNDDLIWQNYRNKKLQENISKSTQDNSYYKNLLLIKCLKAPSSSSISLDVVAKMIDDLFKLEDVKEVLYAISTTDVEIIFDLKHQSTAYFDLKTDSVHFGMFYIKKNQILVAKCESVQSRYGTFTHEATHSAMLSLYNNKCNPYFKDDVNTKIEWQGIVKELKEMHERGEIDEEIIDSVFSCNDEALHESELIVRVPQLYAYHLGVRDEVNGNEQIQNDTIMHLKQKYPRLFSFYDDKVLRDLRIVDGISLRIINDKFKLWDKLTELPIHLDSNIIDIKNILMKNHCTIFNTSSPILLLKLIFDTTRSSESCDANFLKHKSSNIFIDAKILFEIIENCHDKESFISKLNFFLKSVTVKRIIILFDGVSAELSRKSVEKFKKIINVSKKIILLNPPYGFMEAKTIDVTFSWSMNMTSYDTYHMCLNDATKNNIKNKETTFNGKNIEISQVLSDDEMMSMPTEALNFICLEQNIQLNKVSNDSPPYFERKFEEKNNFNNEILTHDEMLKVSKNEKFILLTDPIGNGKSEVLTNLYEQKVKGNVDNQLWIAFGALKSFKKILKDAETVTLEIFYSILGIENSLQKFIFDKFYEINKIILYLDEIDQIDEESRKKLIIFIKNSSFQQVWLTCRPNQEEMLKNQLENVKVYSIKPFNRDEKFKYVNLIANNNHFTDVHCKKLEDFGHFAFPHLIFMIKHLYGQEINDAILTKLKLLTLCEIYFKTFKENIHEYDLKTFDEASTYWSLAFHSELKDDVLGLDYDVEFWSAEKLMQCGLFEDSKRLFINQIVSQLIIAQFSQQKLLKPKKKWGYNDDFAKLFSKILHQNDLKTSRFLVNDLLDNFSEQTNRIDYNIYGEHLKPIISDFGQLMQSINSQELSNIRNYLTKINLNFPGLVRRKYNHYCNTS